jgi:small-conductance mechanosensitive channel
MIELLGVKIPAHPWLLVLLIVLAAVAVAYLLQVVIVKLFKRATRNAGAGIEAQISRHLEIYLFPLLIVVGLILFADGAPLPPKVLRATHSLLVALAVILGTFIAGRTVLLLFRNIARRYDPLRNLKSPAEIAIKLGFGAIGAMIVLDTLGVSITPLITTLGIGSLAVAIALQDTLANLFAGLYIKAHRPLQEGDYVRLDGDGEGYVNGIGWRNTEVRMLSHNTVIVPNSKLIQSHITNYYLPDKDLAVLVEVGVDYDNDLAEVERVTCEVAKEILTTVPGGVADFDPFIRFHTFSQSSIDLTVVLRGQEFTDQFLLKHEFIKRLHRRYQQEGLTIAFPARTNYQAVRRERSPRRLASVTKTIIQREANR